MLERVAKAIELAQEKPRYVVKIYKVWELWDNEKCIMESDVHMHVQDLCEQFNAKYAARMALEALKPASDEMQNKYCEMAKAEASPLKPFFPNAVWERAIDAILSDDK